MWTPTRRERGRPHGQGTQPTSAPVRSTGVLSTACREGGLGQWGGSGLAGGRGPNARKGGPVWESERAIRPMRPGNAGGGKGPYFWCACEGGKER